MIRQAATDFLRNRGFGMQSQVARDVKINELLHRDYKKPPRYALNIVPKAGDTYGDSYVRLCTWIGNQPDALKKEIAHLRFPIFVHCFLGLLVQASNGGDREAPAQFLKKHVPEHAAMNQPEKKKQLEQLIPLASTAALADSPLAKLYFTQRISWTCSQASFEAVTNFLVDEQLYLLLRVLMLYFNIHAVRRDPPPPVETANGTPPEGTAATAAGGGGGGAGAAAGAAAAAAAANAQAGGDSGKSAADGAADGGAPAGSASAPGASSSSAAASAASAAASQYAPLALWGELEPSSSAAPAAAPAATAAAAPPAAAAPAAAAPAAAAPAAAAPAAAAPAAAAPAAAAPAAAAPAAAPAAASASSQGGAAEVKTEGGKAAAPASASKEKRPCSASVCVLRVNAGGAPSDYTSMHLSSCMRLAACGRSDGAISLCRLSRDRILDGRFHAEAGPASQPASVHSLIGHSGPVYSCTTSRDSRFVLSGGQDGVPRLWATRHAQELVAYRTHAHPIFHLSFSPHNAHFLTSCYDGGVRLFTTERRAPLRVLAGHQSEVNFATFHPNGAYAISCSADHTMRLWDISSPACIRLFYGHKGPVNCAAVSNDGSAAASASEDGTLKLWHLGTAKCWVTAPLPDDCGTPHSLCFSASGRVLACAGENSVCIWDLRELQAGSKPDTPPVPPALHCPAGVPLMSAAFMPSHQVLLAAGIDPGNTAMELS